MTTEWQLVDLTAGRRDHAIKVSPASGDTTNVSFSNEGLERPRIGVQAGLDCLAARG
jgi:hypothetical protein